MDNDDLLASLALFGELYDNNKDIYDVIAELLKSAIIHKSRNVLNAEEACLLLAEVFKFDDIPLTIIKTTLKKRLVKGNFLTYKDGTYIVNLKNIKDKEKYFKDYEIAKNNYSEITNSLIIYIKDKWPEDIDETKKNKIIKDLECFLLNKSIDSQYLELITSFIIHQQNNEEFTKKLNFIREGLLLYNGISYSSNINELGSWKSELTIFLDTEYLFSFSGYHGPLYKQIFDDFYGLVKEINASKNIIKLKYFEETKKEIDGFFKVAEGIIEGKQTLDPSKEAMIAIINGCNNKFDVLGKKAKFYDELKQMNIEEEIPCDYFKPSIYNIADKDNIDYIIKNTNNGITENKCYEILFLFTKINFLRQANNNKDLEKIGYIFLSAKHLLHNIAHIEKIKNKRNISFIIYIDTIIEEFWFKLNKGFSTMDKPRSFDIITKTQIALSSLIKDNISNKFKKLNVKHGEGSLTSDQANLLYGELRAAKSGPEDINADNIEKFELFLAEDIEGSIERYTNETSFLKEKVKNTEEVNQELNCTINLLEERLKNSEELAHKIKEKEKQDLLKKQRLIKFIVNCVYYISMTIIALFYLIIIFYIAYYIFKHTKGNTVLTILFGLFGLAGFVPAVIYNIPKKIQKMFISLKQKIYRYYKIE